MMFKNVLRMKCFFYLLTLCLVVISPYAHLQSEDGEGSSSGSSRREQWKKEKQANMEARRSERQQKKESWRKKMQEERGAMREKRKGQNEEMRNEWKQKKQSMRENWKKEHSGQ